MLFSSVKGMGVCYAAVKSCTSLFIFPICPPPRGTPQRLGVFVPLLHGLSIVTIT